MTNGDLTPREREAFASLPRENLPPPGLEDRTVGALRARGLLGGAARPARRFHRGGLAVAAAVVGAALLGAFALGQDLGARRTREAMLAMHEQDASREAVSVQQAGAAYLAVLSDLVRASGEGPRPAEQEAARHALYQVADQMVRLAPDDPLATRILQAFEQVEIPAGDPAPGGDDQIIWF